MARETIGPYKGEPEAADAAYKATRATGEPHTIAALGSDLLTARSWLVARGRIRECWLEKKAVTPPMIAWPVTFVSSAAKGGEDSKAQFLDAPADFVGVDKGDLGWDLPSKAPPAKGKKGGQ